MALVKEREPEKQRIASVGSYRDLGGPKLEGGATQHLPMTLHPPKPSRTDEQTRLSWKTQDANPLPYFPLSRRSASTDEDADGPQRTQAPPPLSLGILGERNRQTSHNLTYMCVHELVVSAVSGVH
jgi:hypothetical protein